MKMACDNTVIILNFGQSSALTALGKRAYANGNFVDRGAPKICISVHALNEPMQWPMPKAIIDHTAYVLRLSAPFSKNYLRP